MRLLIETLKKRVTKDRNLEEMLLLRAWVFHWFYSANRVG